MNHQHLVLPLLLASTLAGQTVTSPRGLDTTEGNAAFAHFGGTRRFQQLDNDQSGQVMLIRTLAWRRNGNVAQNAPARTFDLTVDLGMCDFGRISHQLDENFLPGTRTQVFSQNVNFPDWSANVGAPAPFDFQIMLPNPHLYLGTAALVIDFSYSNNTSSVTLSVDRDFNGWTTPPPGAALGTGCVVTGGTAAFSHTANMGNYDAVPTPAFGMRLRLGGSNAPPSSAILAFVDYQNQNLSGVLCATLYAFPVLMLTLASNATGTVPEVYFGFTHDASLVGGQFFTQLLAIDVGQAPIPVVVSNGRQTTMPSPAYVNSHRCSYGWFSLPSTTGIALHFVGGGMVIQIGQ